MANLGDILARLPALCQADRNAIKQRLIVLEGLDNNTQKPLQNGTFSTIQNDDILRAICDFMASAGLEHPHFAALKASPQYRAFSNKAPAIAEYLKGLSKNERSALLAIGIELLYKNLIEMRLVVTARTLMSHIHRLPACINRSFPGYATAGYLGRIIRKKNGHVRQE